MDVRGILIGSLGAYLLGTHYEGFHERRKVEEYFLDSLAKRLFPSPDRDSLLCRIVPIV